jgi:hypothetical protein
VIRIPVLVTCLVGLAFAGGCSPYVQGLRYVPQPAVIEVRPATTQPLSGIPQQPPPLVVYRDAKNRDGDGFFGEMYIDRP